MKRVWWAAFLMATGAAPAAAQHATDTAEQISRRGGGIRVGVWNVDLDASNSTTSPLVEAYLQRGLDRHLVMENSAAVWWVQTTTNQLGSDVATRSYVVPLLTSLKLYPLTTATDRLEPFLIGGAGFALGIEDEDETAIGGGGTSLVTGFGLKAGIGLTLQLGRGLGLNAGGRYQWIRFGEQLGRQATFGGFGAEAGISYRFQF